MGRANASQVIRVQQCPNCGHLPAAHAMLDSVEVRPCEGDGSSSRCACPLDRAAVNIAVGVAAALVKYGG